MSVCTLMVLYLPIQLEICCSKCDVWPEQQKLLHSLQFISCRMSLRMQNHGYKHCLPLRIFTGELHTQQNLWDAASKYFFIKLIGESKDIRYRYMYEWVVVVVLTEKLEITILFRNLPGEISRPRKSLEWTLFSPPKGSLCPTRDIFFHGSWLYP